MVDATVELKESDKMTGTVVKGATSIEIHRTVTICALSIIGNRQRGLMGLKLVVKHKMRRLQDYKNLTPSTRLMVNELRCARWRPI